MHCGYPRQIGNTVKQCEIGATRAQKNGKQKNGMRETTENSEPTFVIDNGSWTPNSSISARNHSPSYRALMACDRRGPVCKFAVRVRNRRAPGNLIARRDAGRITRSHGQKSVDRSLGHRVPAIVQSGRECELRTELGRIRQRDMVSRSRPHCANNGGDTPKD
jgi:hypothetical protein